MARRRPSPAEGPSGDNRVAEAQPALFGAARFPASEPPPHYHDHRARLRARFQEAGPAALADYELLELILFRAIPRRDVKPLAKALLARFGDVAAVLAADPARIAEIEGCGPAVALDLKVVQAAVERAGRDAISKRPVLTSWNQVVAYCRVALQNESREQFRVLFLDRKNQLIRDEAIGLGTVDHAPVYPREVVRRALELGASALILVHNHPSGDPTPSKADLEITREIQRAAATLEITVHDHLIVGRSGVASFRSLGFL